MKGTIVTMHPYPEGIDCIWVASDSEGNLAAFITAGIAPIPTGALDQATVAPEEVEDLIGQLPVITNAELLVQVPRPDDFVALAERGFYVYDWSDAHRTTREEIGAYEKVATPRQPLVVASVDGPLRDAAIRVRLKDVAFSKERLLNVRERTPCVSGD